MGSHAFHENSVARSKELAYFSAKLRTCLPYVLHLLTLLGRGGAETQPNSLEEYRILDRGSYLFRILTCQLHELS